MSGDSKNQAVATEKTESTQKVTLCLAGGGFRAALTEAGAVRSMIRAGVLPKVKRISSVSGGSVLAALIGINWSNLTRDETDVEAMQSVYVTSVIGPLRKAAAVDVRSRALAGYAALWLGIATSVALAVLLLVAVAVAGLIRLLFSLLSTTRLANQTAELGYQPPNPILAVAATLAVTYTFGVLFRRSWWAWVPSLVVLILISLTLICEWHPTTVGNWLTAFLAIAALAGVAFLMWQLSLNKQLRISPSTPLKRSRWAMNNLRTRLRRRLHSLRNEGLIGEYRRLLFDKRTLSDLPNRNELEVLINSTNLGAAERIVFHRDGVEGKSIGHCACPHVEINLAVAASAAFPPVFTPMDEYFGPFIDPKTGMVMAGPEVSLADGGVLDNLGLNSLLDEADAERRRVPPGRCDDFVVIDGGMPLKVQDFPLKGMFPVLRTIPRLPDIQMRKIGLLVKRRLIDYHFHDSPGHRSGGGVYVGIGNSVREYLASVLKSCRAELSRQRANGFEISDQRVVDLKGIVASTRRASKAVRNKRAFTDTSAALSELVAQVRTDFNRFTEVEAELLLWHGEVLGWLAMETWAHHLNRFPGSSPPELPSLLKIDVPEPLATQCERLLAKSGPPSPVGYIRQLLPHLLRASFPALCTRKGK